MSIFDEVKKGSNKSMGSCVFDIGAVLGSRGGTKGKRCRDGGMIFAQVRKSEGSGLLRLKLKGDGLKNTEGFLRKSDPFYEVSRQVNNAGGATWDNVFRSETIMDNLSPNWKEGQMELSIICGGDLDLPLLVKIYDYESKGDHVLMGQFETSVNGLLSASTDGSQDAGKAITIKKGSKDTGKVFVMNASVSGVGNVSIAEKLAQTSISAPAPKKDYLPPGAPTFVDYIQGGLQINVVVAIDFTGSNGDPRKAGTLHHFNTDGSLNDYEKAISSIVSILEKYDSDKLLPVRGFGAKYDGVVNHDFQCGPTEEVHGVKGVLEAYHQTFKSGLVMSGPTVFTEVIETAAARAESSLEDAMSKGGQSYTVLLILTDGAVSDASATADKLKQLSDKPLSIVIVGVGNADFSSMQFLDDCTPPGERDIAQFVPFNEHNKSSVDLSSATLKEVPSQLVGFFQKRGVQPKAAVDVGEDEIVIEAEEEEIDLSLDIGEEEIVISAGGMSNSSW